MIDLTIIFLTVNKLPPKWAEFQKKTLLEAADGYPIITISRKPLDWGENLIQEGKACPHNVYKQILRGAKLAKTPFIGIAEDDTLYPKHHFHTSRPPLDAVLYNGCLWMLQTWIPAYYLSLKPSNSTLIAPRELVIEALEERFVKHPDQGHFGEIGRYDVEKRLGVTKRKYNRFFTGVGVVHFQHVYSMDILEQKQRKKVGPIRAYDIPHWGRSDKLVKKFC